MTNLYNQAEFEWLKKQTGVTSKFKSDMWDEVYDQQDVEEELGWLKKKIVDAGGTPKDTKFTSDLWKQLLTILGLKVSSSLDENQLTYFLNT